MVITHSSFEIKIWMLNDDGDNYEENTNIFLPENYTKFKI